MFVTLWRAAHFTLYMYIKTCITEQHLSITCTFNPWEKSGEIESDSCDRILLSCLYSQPRYHFYQRERSRQAVASCVGSQWLLLSPLPFHSGPPSLQWGVLLSSWFFPGCWSREHACSLPFCLCSQGCGMNKTLPLPSCPFPGIVLLSLTCTEQIS